MGKTWVGDQVVWGWEIFFLTGGGGSGEGVYGRLGCLENGGRFFFFWGGVFWGFKKKNLFRDLTFTKQGKC